MSYFVVTYDLVDRRNYKRVEDGLQAVSAGQCQKILESVWVVKTSYSKAADVRDFLNKYIDSDDKLFVIGTGESVTPWASMRVDKEATNWLKRQ